ncbi:MAG: Two-component sensor histidine kinase [Candidatus Carbobacillus altaicus]|uniref:histidine kinase n=1 Tax=Candidatus Carbonibacillus altaicus TaxID=2163959 RepID=A0A2R6XYZ9_9BACL|nr:MAG: Two-component sensor histidine kinase [Candidatus Carbobacillus altaicus]
MRHRPLSLHWRITLFAGLLILFTLSLAMVILSWQAENIETRRLRERTEIAARTAATMPEVADWVETRAQDRLYDVIERLRIVHNMDYITVYDQSRIRLVHPNPSRIGEILPKGIDDAAFAEHIYTKKAKGEEGVFIKAYFPIKNKNLEQIGVIVAGKRLPTAVEFFVHQLKSISLAVFLALLIGLVGSWFLALQVKRSLLGLEPHQIVRMYSERLAAFDAIQEGVIAIDMEEKVTIFNRSAKRILHVEGETIGHSIRDLIPDTRLPEVLEARKPFVHTEFRLGNQYIVSTRVPIMLGDEMIGALAVFTDRTEAASLAEMLTGVQAYAEALKIQAHEHKNVLHAIAGMLELDKKDEALKYLHQVHVTYDEWLKITSAIKVPSIAGLILGKMAKAKTLNIVLMIDRDSAFHTIPERLTAGDMVTIIGNLLENAFDALKEIENPDKRVILYIYDDDTSLTIAVNDNGPGIDERVLDRLFERGVSGKDDSHLGVGLYLVRNVVERAGGWIDFETQQGEGAEFVVTIPKKEK